MSESLIVMNYWLVKQEPEAYSWDDFVRDGGTVWTGVRNFLARNNLRAMKRSDRVLFYHSVSEKAVRGEAKVSREAYPDPTASEGDWSCVEIQPVAEFARPVSLEEIKRHPELAQVPLIRQSRLSVMALTKAEYEAIRGLSRKKAGSAGALTRKKDA